MSVIFGPGIGRPPNFAQTGFGDQGPIAIEVLDTGGGSDRPGLRPTGLQFVHHTTLPTVPGVGYGVDWVVPNAAGADVPVSSLVGR